MARISRGNPTLTSPQPKGGGKPQWDPKSRRLTFHGRVVKHFRQPAACQEMILAAFEEEAWPQSIDDPLPGRPGQDPKQRLRDAIENLNRHQMKQLIRFRGNGLGTGISWESLAKA